MALSFARGELPTRRVLPVPEVLWLALVLVQATRRDYRLRIKLRRSKSKTWHA